MNANEDENLFHNLSLSARIRIRFSNQNSLPLSVVLADGFDNPVLGFEDSADGFALAIAELEHDFSVGFKKVTRFGSEAAVKIQTIGAAIQG